MRARRAQPRRLFRRADAGFAVAVASEIIDEAMEDQGDMTGRACLIVCTGVGKAHFVPPGYELETCRDCGSDVCVNGGLFAAAKGRGMRIIALCTDCLDDSPVAA